MKKAHALCRPPRGAGKPDGATYDNSEPLRLGDDGKWRPDNGQPARAFIYKLGLGSGAQHFACIANCDCPYTNGCPLGNALAYADDNLGITAINVDRRRKLSPREAAASRNKKR